MIDTKKALLLLRAEIEVSGILRPGDADKKGAATLMDMVTIIIIKMVAVITTTNGVAALTEKLYDFSVELLLFFEL